MKTKSASQTGKNVNWKNAILLAITALALSASPGSRAEDADCLFLASWDNPGTGDWFDPSNWAQSSASALLKRAVSRQRM